MSFDLRRIYYNAVLGGLGGLVAWVLVSLLSQMGGEGDLALYLRDAAQGAAVGLCIGAAIGSAEGLTRSRSPVRMIKGMIFGGPAGLVAGGLGLIAGEIIFRTAGGGVLPRALGWALFGLLLGASLGLPDRSPTQAGYGALGGLLGGLTGGATYERTSLIFRAIIGNRDLSLTLGGAAGLIILGAAIGAMIGLVEDILRTAWFKFVHGKLEGQTRTLDPRKPVQVLGCSDGCDIVIPGDPDVQQRHAQVRREDQAFVITPLDGQVVLRGPGGDQTVQRHRLQTNDTICLGKSRMIFYAGEEL
jgi:hypothetical protein